MNNALETAVKKAPLSAKYKMNSYCERLKNNPVKYQMTKEKDKNRKSREREEYKVELCQMSETK